MSQENVEIVRTLVALWNAGDRDLTRSIEYLDPSVQLEGPLSSFTAEPYQGYGGIERWMRDLDEQFDLWAIDIDELRQVGDHVVVRAAIKARGRASGAHLDFGSVCIVDFGSDHRVTGVHIYPNVHEALKALGLEE
jgi:ketosteroid isomerase-like protein